MGSRLSGSNRFFLNRAQTGNNYNGQNQAWERKGLLTKTGDYTSYVIVGEMAIFRQLTCGPGLIDLNKRLLSPRCTGAARRHSTGSFFSS
jgi:hypothetical protein